LTVLLVGGAALYELKQSEPQVEIIWKAFELRPEPVPTLDPRGDSSTMFSHCFSRSTHIRRNSFEYRPTRFFATRSSFHC